MAWFRAFGDPQTRRTRGSRTPTRELKLGSAMAGLGGLGFGSGLFFRESPSHGNSQRDANS